MFDPSPTFRRSIPADGPAIRELLLATFPQNPKADPDVMWWQYWDNPFGQVVGSVAEVDGRIVSHLARLPIPITIRGRGFVGDWSSDAATLPEFRGRGLYSRARVHANDEALKEGLATAIDFRAAQTRLPTGSAEFAARVRTLALPIGAAWLSDRTHLPKAVLGPIVAALKPRGISDAVEVESTPEDVDSLWGRLHESVQAGILKDQRWWGWRYDAHPKKPYRYFAVRDPGSLTGLAVTRRQADGRVVILEFLARSRDAARQLVRVIANESADAGALVFMGTGVYADIARGAGLLHVPNRIAKSPRFHLRPQRLDHDAVMSARWAVTAGDMDHL